MSTQTQSLKVCNGCDKTGFVEDELFVYDLPIGLVWLCLNCGPDERS